MTVISVPMIRAPSGNRDEMPPPNNMKTRKHISASKPYQSSATRRSLNWSIPPYSYALLLPIVAGIVVANFPSIPLDLEDAVTNDNPIEKSDDCESCVLLVKSFEKGLDRTQRGKHEGGDTSWEEGHLKSYADSEVRLVEIQDDLCNELETGKAQCLSMAETGEQHIEHWWFELRKKNVRLHDYLCIKELKKCCPDETFGPKCRKCPDCGGNGKCDGSGTRGGSGQCNCNQGYTGELCNTCDDNYYSSRFGGEGKFECLSCHKACKGGCSGPTSANCTECAPGYLRDPKTNLCNDINECELGPNEISLDPKRLCKDGTFCENTDGHYKCSPCHHVCETCLDYGPDKCLSCVSEYHMDENHTCIHFSAQSAENSNISHYSYFIMEVMALVILHYCTTKLTQFLLRVTNFRRFDFFDDLITESILRLSLSLPIVLLMGHLNSHGFIRRYITLIHRSIVNLLGFAEATESASLDAKGNISSALEL